MIPKIDPAVRDMLDNQAKGLGVRSEEIVGCAFDIHDDPYGDIESFTREFERLQSNPREAARYVVMRYLRNEQVTRLKELAEQVFDLKGLAAFAAARRLDRKLRERWCEPKQKGTYFDDWYRASEITDDIFRANLSLDEVIEDDWLAQCLYEHCHSTAQYLLPRSPRLFDADDVAQEAWIHLKSANWKSGAPTEQVYTTVLNLIRSWQRMQNAKKRCQEVLADSDTDANVEDSGRRPDEAVESMQVFADLILAAERYDLGQKRAKDVKQAPIAYALMAAEGDRTAAEAIYRVCKAASGIGVTTNTTSQQFTRFFKRGFVLGVLRRHVDFGEEK